MSSRILYPLDFVALSGMPLDIRYACSDNFTGSKLPGYERPKALLRKHVAEALWQVQHSLLSQGLSIYIFDAYRPQRAVDAMVKWAERNDPNMLVMNYVARRSSHSRGIAVDVTLARVCNIHGVIPVDMGTEFDSFSELSHTAHQEISPKQKYWRQLLVGEMGRMGFVNYEREWWHFTYQGKGVTGGWYDFCIW